MIKEPQFFNFANPHSIEEIAEYIGIEPAFLHEIISAEDPARFYIEHKIPKRRAREANQFRTVWEINSPELLTAQKSFQRRFEAFAGRNADYPSEYAHGYVSGRSTVTNAQIHAGAKFILHADIQDFFPTITAGRLEDLFRGLKMNEDAARTLARFVTIGDRLPLGLPASPLLANLICRSLDERFKNLAEEKGVAYSRYADDIVFSGDAEEKLPSRIEVRSILASEGFGLSEKKFRVTKRGQAHFVTGLSVSEARPFIPRKIKRRLKQELYYAKKFDLKSHLSRAGAGTFQSGINRIDGTIHYIHGVEPELAKKLQAEWKEILEANNAEPGYESRLHKAPWSLAMFVDESEIDTADGKVLAIACVTIEDLNLVEAETVKTLRRCLASPFIPGDKARLAKKGLHFVDASDSIRTEYLNALTHLPFRGFIVYDLLPDDAGYEKKYFELLNDIIPKRLMKADRADLTIIIEENSKISFEKIKSSIEDKYSALAAKHQRRPLKLPGCIKGKKLEHPCLSVVDFILGVFGGYAVLNEPIAEEDEAKPKAPGALKNSRYEQMREKIRLIKSGITGEHFTRKNPFVPWKSGKPTEKSSA